MDSARDECLVLGGTGHYRYTGFINGSRTPNSGFTLTGSKANSINFAAATMYYVADLGKYIIFPWSAADNNIYEINPAANYSCEIFAVTGTPPPKAAQDSGWDALFTRFFFMPELKLMGVYGSSGVTSNTYVFKYL